MNRREGNVLGLPDESEVLEAMGIRCTQAVERKEAESKPAYADYFQMNQVDKDEKLTHERESTAPQFGNASIEDIRFDYLIPEEAWQEIPDYVFFDEPADQCHDTESAEGTDDIDVPEHVRARKRGGRRHKGHFMKRPMAMSEVIEELQHPELRENALRCLSGHLIERREQDGEFYRQAGYFLFYSCSTVPVLLQEVLSVYERLYSKDLKVRGSKRLSNVLTLLQSIAANEETRWDFVRAGIPNYLLPFILADYSEEVYENIRAISLSVIGVLCQARDIRIIKWAVESDLIEVCIFSLEIGSELSKVLAMTILESMFRKNEGIFAMCETNINLLPKFIKLCGDLVNIVAEVHGFAPRLLFLIVRVLILLCQNRRALELLRDHLPQELQDSTFNDLKREYPLFNYLVHQLLLYTGKAKHYIPTILATSKEPTPCPGPSPPSTWGMEVNFSATIAVTPWRRVDFDKRNWE